MVEDKDGADVRIPPPLAYLAFIGVGVGLGWLWPLPLLPGDPIRLWGGVAVIGAGVALAGTAIRAFLRTGQHPDPRRPTPKIVPVGAFRITRNPMYVGLGLVQVGIGVAVANAWIVVLVVLSLVVVYLTAVRHEEAYLERKFGEEYLQYKRSVRRWL